MNELENQVAQLVKRAIEVAEVTGEFVIEQAPQVLKEVYMWHTTSYILGIVLGISMIIIGRYSINLFTEKYTGEQHKSYGDIVLFGRFGDSFGIAFPLALGFVFGSIIICINVYELAFITLAPKLYLIEYFMK